MGYGGYVSAKLPPPQPSAVEAAVQAVKSIEAVELIHKLCYNAAVQPKDDKFRKVRLTNPKIKAVLGDTAGAVDAMTALGWVEEGEEHMVIPAGKFMSMQQIRIIEAARDRLAKDLKDQERFSKAGLVA